MAKAMYVGVGGKARKVKKAYFGVDGKARKVKKVYFGVDGKARCIFSGGELSYYGLATPLSVARDYAASANVGDYVLFTGGTGNSGVYALSTVDAYDKNLTHYIPTPLNINVYSHTGASIKNDYALFNGGTSRTDSSDSSYLTNNVSIYDAALTKYTRFTVYTRVSSAGAFVGDYALFGGGYNQNGNLTNVETFDSNLTYKRVDSFGLPRDNIRAGHVGGYAVFCMGNYIADGRGSTDAYDASLTHIIAEKSNQYGTGSECASTSDYLILAGATNKQYGGHCDNDAYDKNLTRFDIAKIPEVNPGTIAGGSSEEYALFVSIIASQGDGNNVYTYDLPLTLNVVHTLSVRKTTSRISNGTIGDYVLFAGGKNASDYSRSDTVDVFQIS